MCVFLRPVLLQRISECRRLNVEYQRSFQTVRDKLRENPDNRQFDFRWTLSSSFSHVLPDTVNLSVSQPVIKWTLSPLFSENYIFGKFDAFCRRLEKIADMASTMESLAALQHMKVIWF